MKTKELSVRCAYCKAKIPVVHESSFISNFSNPNFDYLSIKCSWPDCGAISKFFLCMGAESVLEKMLRTCTAVYLGEAPEHIVRSFNDCQSQDSSG